MSKNLRLNIKLLCFINEKRKNSVRAGKDPDSLKRRDVFVLLAFSVFSALAETAVFSALNIILF